jgi:hypothetical protein
VLRAEIDGPTYAAAYYDPRGAEEHRFPLPAVPYLKLAAVHDDRAGSLTLFALNRSLAEALPLDVTARGYSGFAVAQALTLHDSDLDAANTKDAPERIRPSPLEGVAVQGAHPPRGTSSGSLLLHDRGRVGGTLRGAALDSRGRPTEGVPGAPTGAAAAQERWPLPGRGVALAMKIITRESLSG